MDANTVKLYSQIEKLGKFFGVFGYIAGGVFTLLVILNNIRYIEFIEVLGYLILGFLIYAVFTVLGLFLRVIGKILVKVSWISKDIYDIKNK